VNARTQNGDLYKTTTLTTQKEEIWRDI
jgi:hypothetical protein